MVCATRRRGFTLIELLVVIAIIAILAAMLFPVFARARESARKIQCLSNIKNIAMAFQMYLSDYDRLMPAEHRQEVIDWILQNKKECCCDYRITTFNPYLKAPVVLDEYIKNRDVWNCPSARNYYPFSVNSGYAANGGGDWFTEVRNSNDCSGLGSCNFPFPSGWGGSVTDSFSQGACAGSSSGGLQWSIGVPWSIRDLKTSAISDPVRRVVCGDAGMEHIAGFERTSALAYPDMCHVDKNGWSSSCGGDWGNCAQSQACSPPSMDAGGNGRWAVDPQYRKDLGKPRHIGGSNIGFADGHAAWMSSEEILFSGDNESGYGNNSGKLEGVSTCFCAAVNK